jgi:hypothetical protein
VYFAGCKLWWERMWEGGRVGAGWCGCACARPYMNQARRGRGMSATSTPGRCTGLQAVARSARSAAARARARALAPGFSKPARRGGAGVADGLLSHL